MFRVSDVLNESSFQDLSPCDQLLTLTRRFAEQAKTYGLHIRSDSERGRKQLLTIPIKRQREILKNFIVYYEVLESAANGEIYDEFQRAHSSPYQPRDQL